jgi:hypothetical protein
MAYQKETKRAIAGGLNLLMRGDQIGEDEAQTLINWSVDSFGALRSRRGHTVRHSLGGRVLTMLRGVGALWTATSGGTVYRDGAGIISGLSGEVGLASWKDFIWAMSTGDQRKSDGSSDWKWIPAAPTGKPTAEPSSEVTTPIVDFSGGFLVDPAGDETYDPTLTITASQDSVYSATKDSVVDVGSGHSLDDVLRITVWAKKWKRINEIVFEVDCNGGDFTTDYFTARMSKKVINGARKEAITFYLRKRPQEVDIAAVDKKRYGWFDRIGSTANKGWNSVAAVRIKVDFSGLTQVRFDEWVCVGDQDNTLEGDDFQVYYTYTTAAAHESNPSEPSEPITVNRTGIAVTNMVASPDPQVVGQNVYVTGGTLAHVYRVNVDPIVGTSYTITASFDDLTNLGLQLEDDHEQPPVVAGLAGPYYGRLIAFGGSKVYFSHINRPYAFAGPLLDDGDWIGADESAGELLAATQRPGMMWIYGKSGVEILQGDPGDLSSAIHKAACQFGIQSPNGVTATPRGDLAAMSEGIYVFNGDSATLLSKKIDPAMKDGFDFTSACVGFRNDIAWVSDGSVTYLYDANRDWWTQDSRTFTCFYSDQDILLGGTSSGEVLELNSGFSDAGAAIPLSYKSKAYGATVDCACSFEDLTVWSDTGGATLTITAHLNDGCEDAFQVLLGTISSTSEERNVLQFAGSFGVKARTCAIGITGSATSEVVITKLTLNYYPEARRAKSFDSDEQNLGTVHVKELFEVQVDLNGESGCQLIIQSDQPGFAMSTRDSSHSFAASTTRRADMAVLSESVLGHNHRYLLNGEDFMLYGLRALVQVIGTLMHGSKGQFYRSDPLAFGGERVNLFKEIHIKMACTGTAVVSVLTELPDGSLQSVVPVPNVLTSTGGVRWRDLQTRKIRLPGTAKGRVIQITITPTDDFRLEELGVFFKTIGMPQASGWAYAECPLQKTAPAIWQEIPQQMDQTG